MDTRTEEKARNPFIPISWGWRLLLIAYLLIYLIVTPSLDAIVHGPGRPLAGWRIAAEMIYHVLVFAPILFYRTSWGWVHPLIFGTAFGLAKSIGTNPGQLLRPFRITYESLHQPLQNPALTGWTQEAIAWADLKGTGLMILAVSVYYFAFFLAPKPDVPRFNFSKPKGVAWKALATVGFAAVVFLVYVGARGGINSHILSWQYGRGIDSTGHIKVLVRLGALGCLAWFALRETAYRNPLFWGAALAAGPLLFLSTGSRSSLIFFYAMLLLLWMVRHQKIPKTRVLAMACVAYLLVGMLGTLRNSMYGERVRWEVLTDFDLEEMLTRSEESISRRPGGYVPVIAKVPNEVSLLYGESYLGTGLFFVPRVIWQGKPMGVGKINGTRIFGRRAAGGGVPVNGVGEAFWNFHIPGVVIVYFLFGVFHRWLARGFRRYGHIPAAQLLFVLTLFWLTEPSGLKAVTYFHHIIPTVVLLYWMGALAFRKRTTRHPAYASS